MKDVDWQRLAGAGGCRFCVAGAGVDGSGDSKHMRKIFSKHAEITRGITQIHAVLNG